MTGTTARGTPSLTFARILGFGAALCTIILCCAFLFLSASSGAPSAPSSPGQGAVPAQRFETDVLVVGDGIILLGLLAAWGALSRRPVLLLVAFVISFFPVGLYMLGTLSVFALIGISHLLYLVAALIMIIQRRRKDRG